MLDLEYKKKRVFKMDREAKWQENVRNSSWLDVYQLPQQSAPEFVEPPLPQP